MARSANRLDNILVRAMFALAAMLFALAPAMDALAKDGGVAPSAGVLQRVLAAFDVLDDVLDHRPGHAPAAHQHHVAPADHVAPAAFGEALTATKASPRWAYASDAPRPTLSLDPLGRPPRS